MTRLSDTKNNDYTILIVKFRLRSHH